MFRAVLCVPVIYAWDSSSGQCTGVETLSPCTTLCFVTHCSEGTPPVCWCADSQSPVNVLFHVLSVVTTFVRL